VAGDPKTNRQSLGYGIISFYDEAELERCLAAMNNSKVQSNTISLTRQAERRNLDPRANLFVRNLDRAVP